MLNDNDLKKRLNSLLMAAVFFAVYLLIETAVSIALIAIYALRQRAAGMNAVSIEKLIMQLDELSSGNWLAATIVLSAVFTVGVYIIILAATGHNPLARLNMKPIDLKSTGLIIFSGILINLVISIVMGLTLSEELLLEYEKASAGLRNDVTVMSALAVVIIAPIFEEIVFRGVLYRYLKEGTNAIAANFIQAALFGFCHGNMIWGVATFAMGLCFAASYEYKQSLVAPIIMHISVNAFAFGISLIIR